MTVLWWIRDDLRIADNPALTAAAEAGPVVAVHVDERIDGARAPGGACRWWLHHSLDALATDLRLAGVPLVLASGDPRDVLPRVVELTGAHAVAWNRRYHQPQRDVDAQLKESLRAAGVAVQSFPGHLLHEPWTLHPVGGSSYKVFAAYARAAAEQPPPREPLSRPEGLHGPADSGADVEGLTLGAWLEPDAFGRRLAGRGWLPTRPDWTGGLRATWRPGEAAGLARLDALADVLPLYPAVRDRPDIDGTSGLSPHLRFGEVSVAQAWHHSALIGQTRPGAAEGITAFRRQLTWRDFAWHRRYHLPDLATRNVRAAFDGFAWQDDPDALRAWQQGRTGYALVDAGMRQLWHTGTMHNRVRMVVASFLAKNLRLDWRLGEQWFWDTLVDADEANNPFNWQWAAGTGDDAAPYVRIFNPERQRERFDPEGAYVARWAPETLAPPIVDLAVSRAAALEAYQQVSAARAR